MSDVSVVIPSYNSAATVTRTLESLLKQGNAAPREIIVVDSSDDGKTPAVLSDYEKRNVRVIRLPKQTIPAVARNIGAEQAVGHTLAFIDSDAYAPEDWLERIIQACKDGCHAGGGSILLPEFQKNKLMVLGQYFLQFNDFMDIGPSRQKPFVTSCNFFCEKELFHKVGGFPEIRASEDVLLGHKLTEIYPVCFIPNMKVYHVFREKLSAYVGNQMLLGRYILVQKRIEQPEKFYFKVPWAFFFMPGFLIIKFFRIFFRIAAAGPSRCFVFIISFPCFLIGFLSWAWGFVGQALQQSKE